MHTGSGPPGSCQRASRTRASAAWLAPLPLRGGLVFIGAASDNRLRAIDSKTGKELWVAKFDRVANANPMTYQGKNGKQYVGVRMGGFANFDNRYGCGRYS